MQTPRPQADCHFSIIQYPSKNHKMYGRNSSNDMNVAWETLLTLPTLQSDMQHQTINTGLEKRQRHCHTNLRFLCHQELAHLQKINMEPQNWWFVDEFSGFMLIFRGVEIQCWCCEESWSRQLSSLQVLCRPGCIADDPSGCCQTRPHSGEECPAARISAPNTHRSMSRNSRKPRGRCS